MDLGLDRHQSRYHLGFAGAVATCQDRAMSLTAEQRRALAMLATAGRNGATQALLSALGFDASMIAELVNRGLVTLTAEKVRAGGKLMAVAKARITDAGRDALAAEGQ
jgi:hypothetical protein